MSVQKGQADSFLAGIMQERAGVDNLLKTMTNA